MKKEPKAYFTGIEEKLIDYINNANSSIIVAVAWFTSKELKEALITKKSIDPEINIEIVVDTNKVNDKYFFDYKSKFLKVGIILKDKIKRKFLHNKFIVIDNEIVITGSYNFSKKAKSNYENIIIIYSNRLSLNYSRLFRFLTEIDFIDENILLLFDYPNFAQKLLSTYYKFTKKEYQKYENKIKLGHCFTYPNGFYDEINYEAGFMFNPKVKIEKRIKNIEFELPINKEKIKWWVFHRNSNLTYQSYIELKNTIPEEEFWKDFSNDMDELMTGLKTHFSRKEENTFNAIELEKLINEKVDIVIEDELWKHNFKPFINKEIIGQLFEIFNPVKKGINTIGEYEEIKE